MSDAQNDYLTDFNVKLVTITLQTHENESTAQAAFSTKKAEAQTTIDGRGISGDKLEDVKKYPNSISFKLKMSLLKLKNSRSVQVLQSVWSSENSLPHRNARIETSRELLSIWLNICLRHTSKVVFLGSITGCPQ